jgi:large subunit ribosomal protein L29
MKQSEINKLSLQDLKDALVEAEGGLKTLKLSHAVSEIENPLQIRTKRRDVARLRTELRKRELENNDTK